VAKLQKALTGRIAKCLLRVKLRRTQYEHMFSALPPNSDIARRSPHVSNVPRAVIHPAMAPSKTAS